MCYFCLTNTGVGVTTQTNTHHPKITLSSMQHLSIRKEDQFENNLNKSMTEYSVSLEKTHSVNDVNRKSFVTGLVGEF